MLIVFYTRKDFYSEFLLYLYKLSIYYGVQKNNYLQSYSLCCNAAGVEICVAPLWHSEGWPWSSSCVRIRDLLKSTSGEGEAENDWCPAELQGSTRLYQRHPTDPSKASTVINYWIPPPQTHSDSLAHADAFEKPKLNINRSLSECGASWQLDSEVPQPRFVFSFFRISVLSVVLLSIFHSRGLYFLHGVVVGGRSGWGVLPSCSSYLSHKEKKMPIPARTKARGERSARQWSSWALHTQNTHIRVYIMWWTPKKS